MRQIAALSDKSINYVKNAIDLMVADLNDDFPVMESVLTKTGIATEKQLEKLVEAGHIGCIFADVPSTLVPGKIIKMKAYYTERRIPALVRSMKAPETFSIEGKIIE